MALTDPLTSQDNATTGAVFIPEVWSDLVLRATTANLVATGIVEIRDKDVAAMGDIIHFPISSIYTDAAYTEGTDLLGMLNVNTESEKTITIDQYRVCPFHISDKLSAQSQYDKMVEDFWAAGYAIAKTLDTAVLANSASFTTTAINAAATAVTNLDLTEAQRTLDLGNVPAIDRNWVFSPYTIKDLMDLTGNYFSSIDFNDTKPLMTGQLGKMLLGSPVFKTNNLPTSTTGSPATTYRQNLYMHKQAIGLARQIKPEVQQEATVRHQGVLGNVRSLYGDTCLRPTFGVIINGQ